MATKIIHKKSSVASRVPVAADIAPGELALNLADQKIYSKQTDGTIIEMAPQSGELDDGDIFIGNSSNQTTTASLTTEVQSIGDARYVNVTGDTMTGTLDLEGGSFSSGTDTNTNAALVIASGKQILGDDGNYLRNLLTWTSGNQIEIGQTTTSLITGINLLAGSSGTVKANGQRVFAEDYHPNADKWTTARTLTLSGDASGNVSWDGSANATLSVTVADDSHNHNHSDGGFTVNGALTATASNSNELNGHHYFTAYDANGNHYPHYRSGSSNNGAQVNLRVQNNAGTWDVFYLDADSNDITWRGNKVWNAGNDGSGSGLDADLLDGVQGSSYLRSDAADTFTTLSGTQLNIGSEIQLSESTDRADLLQISSTTGGWGGLQIRNSSNEGRWSFMTDGATAGIYDDENNDWHIQMTENAGVNLYHNNLLSLQTVGANGIRVGSTTSSNIYMQDTDHGERRIHCNSNRLGFLNSSGGWSFWSDDAGDIESVGGANFGNNTLTADGQNDVFMFATSATSGTAQAGAFHNKLRILGGSSQTRDLQLYQVDGEYAHIGSSWPSNQLTIDSNLTQVNFNQPIYVSSNTVWNAGNDGSGSGLDADLLDGIQASGFLRSNADDSFSGGLVSTARDEGIFGTYDSTKTDHIWSMGTAYKNHASGTNFGNLYGLAYKHTNNTTGGTMASGHQMVWCQNGTPYSAMGTNIWTSGSVIVGGTVDGRDVATDGSKLDGIDANANNYSFPYTVSASASNSTVVQRHSSGYIYANYFNTTPNDIATGSITKIVAESGNDGFMRHATAPAVRSFLNVADGANNYSLPATPSVTSLNLADKITHTGDTDTYFQFHGANLARMVIAGAEVQEWGANYTLFSDNDTVRLGSGSDFRMWFDGSNTYFRNYSHANGDVFFQGEGSDGVNETAMKLDFSGTRSYVNLYENNSLRLNTTDYGISITGDLTASGEVISLSDVNFKENITSLETSAAIDIVNSLRPVSYNMIGEDATNVKVGFIAQEVEKVLPEVVHDNNGVLGVSYGNMIAVLTSALQDALTRIEELENVISNK